MIKKMTLCILAISVMMLSPILSSVAYAQKTFIVGVEDHNYYPQYWYDSKKQEYSGYAREVLDLFAKQHNYQFIYKPYPVNRLFTSFINEKVDFKFPDNSYWKSDVKKESGKRIIYSQPVTEYVDGVVVLPENKGKGLEHLKKMGTIMGFTPWSYLSYINDGRIKLSENPEFSGILKQTIMGRIDGAYINIAVARHQLKTQLKQPGLLVFDPDLPYIKSNYYLSTIKFPRVVEEFNKFLVKEAQQINDLKKKYGILIDSP